MRAWLAVLIVALAPASARTAALFPTHGGATVQEVFEQAARWSSISGLSDGIQVGVEVDFSVDLGALPSEITAL